MFQGHKSTWGIQIEQQISTREASTENRNTSRRDSCFHLIDSARPDFDQLVEFMIQTWTHRKWGRVCREAQPIQSLKFRLQQVLVTTIWLTF